MGHSQHVWEMPPDMLQGYGTKHQLQMLQITSTKAGLLCQEEAGSFENLWGNNLQPALAKVEDQRKLGQKGGCSHQSS